MAEPFVVSGGLVMAASERGAQRADIVITGDTITAIAPPGTVPGPRVDATDRLIIPGLVNAHTHGHGGLSKGLGDKWSLELLLNAGPWINGQRNDEDRYLSTLISAIEMLRKGCTACFDLAAMLPVPTAEGLHEIARAYHDIGMRAVVAPMIADRSFYQAIPGLLDVFPAELRSLAETMRVAPAETTLAPLREAARTWSFFSETVRLGIAPTIPLHCSDEFLIACRDLSAEFGLPLQTHLAESPAQRAGAERRYGSTMTAHLHTLGLVGPSFSGAHGIWIDEAEMALIARNGGTLAHNPGSNLRLGNGIADMRRAIAAGVTVGVGTDGSGSSDNQNMFEAMRLAAYVSRVFDRPPDDWIGAGEALRMATEGSAAVLGMSEMIGRIAPGYKADLTFLDLDHVNLVPLNNAVNQLVNTEDGAAVRDVMIGGRFVLRDGVLPHLDWPSIAQRAREAAQRLNTANSAARDAAEHLAPLVSHFCVGLGRCEHTLPRLLPATSLP
jgi:5-methylthioadenosine/S-adenosylhomocysteine deaminase